MANGAQGWCVLRTSLLPGNLRVCPKRGQDPSVNAAGSCSRGGTCSLFGLTHPPACPPAASGDMSMRYAAGLHLFLVALAAAALAGSKTAAAGSEARSVEFNRDIRPILADNCYACHGPDKNQRKAGLRLDTEESALADRGAYKIITPGKPEQSELYRRISSVDPKVHMPQPRFGKNLTAKQVETIRQWIAQGAKWQKHWSLIPPKRHDLPPV